MSEWRLPPGNEGSRCCYNYDSSPYGNYANSGQGSPYPVQYEDTRLPPKERVLGVVVGGQAKAYRFSSFDY